VFKITNLHYQKDTGLVFMVDWEASKENNGVVAKTTGCQILTTKSLDAPDFVQIQNLTESMVVDWIKSEMGNERVEQIEAVLIYQINKPQIQISVPWMNEA
jgi:uncharacterized membrane protein